MGPPPHRPMLLRLPRLLSLCALLLAPLLASAATERGPLHPAPRSAPAEDPAGARVIVKYKALGQLMRAASADPSAARGPQQAAQMALRHRLPMTDGRIIDRRSQVLFASGVSSAELAARLATDDDVEYAVPDRRRRALAVPNDPLFPNNASNALVAGQWYLRAPDSTLVSAINAVGAWDVTTGSASIVVAILDTGVIRSHPDLSNKLLAGYDFIADSTDARDGNGRDSDPSDAGDWTTANQCDDGEPATDSSWHGTVTAGLVGAQTNNGVGMASVGYNVMVLPVRVLGPCGGYDSDIIAGLRWAAGISTNPVANANPARVINLSLGSQGSCSAAYRDAINEVNAAGVVVVASAGNDEGLAVATPANCSGVIAVAGLRHAGTKVGFSSLGPQVAIAGPAGNCVNSSGACVYSMLSTTNLGTQSPGANSYTDGTNYAVGTSFTSPLVAGTAALMLSANPSLTPTQVRTLLQSSARAFPTTSTDPSVPMCRAPTSVVQDECICTTSTCGAGMLDAGAAVVAAAATTRPEVRIQGAASWVVGDALTLDGSSSSVASGRTVRSYAWAITAGSGLARIDGASNAASVRLVATGAGSVTVQLTVTDSLGVSSSASSVLNVSAVAAPTVRVLSSAQVVSAGSSVSFDGSGSSVGSGLTVAAYQWSITSGGTLASFSGGTTGPTASVVTAGTGSGSFTVQLTVTDSLGQQSSANTTVSVTALAPSASISASTASIGAGSNMSFDGSGSTAPSGRSIASYAWAITSGSNIASISGSNSTSAVTVATSAAGSFTIQLTVTDSAGAQDTRSSTVTVTAASSGSSGGGGGGAVSPVWLLGLALAVLALARPRPR